MLNFFTKKAVKKVGRRMTGQFLQEIDPGYALKEILEEIHSYGMKLPFYLI